ncbi:MAG TPA: hypothetical protein VLC46_20370 [Thermoanaerobaculia bacterium]|jgi:hypothetical protein|nr:hypothetical protein [Thermoanaerobaculia bacterium]
MTTGRITIDVSHCARCGEDHKSLEFFQRSRPIQIGNLLFRYWALCPNTDRAINMRMVEGGSEQS